MNRFSCLAVALAVLAAPADAPAQPAATAAAGLRAGQGIFRAWTPRGDSALDPASLPLTRRAREAADADRVSADDAVRECAAPGMPAMLDTRYRVTFAEAGDRIVMRFEEWDATRTVYMNPRNGPPLQEPSPLGVSFGRWEGRTLAIFTTYIDHPYFDSVGTPQSAAVTVLERYTPSVDETRLDWEAIVTDAATFTTPVTRRGLMTLEPAGELAEPPGGPHPTCRH